MHELVETVDTLTKKNKEISQNFLNQEQILLENELLKHRVKAFEESFLKNKESSENQLRNQLYKLQQEMHVLRQENMEFKIDKQLQDSEDKNSNLQFSKI